jgi:hypothetical protein
VRSIITVSERTMARSIVLGQTSGADGSGYVWGATLEVSGTAP